MSGQIESISLINQLVETPIESTPILEASDWRRRRVLGRVSLIESPNLHVACQNHSGFDFKSVRTILSAGYDRQQQKGHQVVLHRAVVTLGFVGSQLMKADKIGNVRSNLVGRMVLG